MREHFSEQAISKGIAQQPNKPMKLMIPPQDHHSITKWPVRRPAHNLWPRRWPDLTHDQTTSWLPDTRVLGFVEECRRQSLAAKKYIRSERDVMSWVEAIGDTEGWTS